MVLCFAVVDDGAVLGMDGVEVVKEIEVVGGRFPIRTGVSRLSAELASKSAVGLIMRYA